MEKINNFSYAPKDCPGRIFHSSDNEFIGCSLCGMYVKKNDSKGVVALTAVQFAQLIPCIAVQNILRETVNIILEETEP
jgi:hypothetical protein